MPLKRSAHSLVALATASMLLLAVSTAAHGSASGAASQPHGAADQASDTTFKPVAVGAGGFVTGISFSDDGATRLVRTDVSGGYRWANDKWQLVTTSTSLPAADVAPGLAGGVLATAVAPSDASVAYIAYNDAVYRSNDAGQSWDRVLSGVSTAPNDSFRTLASRLTVDPRNPDVVYYGTQLGGLYLTHDGGTTWSHVSTTSVPAGALVDINNPKTRGSLMRATDVNSKIPHLAGAGVNIIAVDRSAGAINGVSSTLYATSYGNGVYRSADAGVSWSKISPAGMLQVSYLRVQDNGDLILTSHSNPTQLGDPSDVWRFHNGVWSKATVSPKASNWQTIAVDPHTPGRDAVIAPGGRLALSSDRGQTWKVMSRTQSSDTDIPWLARSMNGGANWMGTGELAFDPVVPGRLWLSEGTGVWYADLQPGSTTVNWSSQSRGIEELVSTGVMSPPGGKPVMTAWDRPIFRSEDLDTYPDHYGPVNKFGSAWGEDWSVSDPSYLVASVASHQAPNDPSSSGYSTDGGQTWHAFSSIPFNSRNGVTTFGFGSMAVSAPGNIVWTPAYGKRPQYTLDGGITWKNVDLPGVSDYAQVDRQPYYVNRKIIAADKAVPGTFYLYVINSGTFRSTDSGQTWERMSDDSAMRNTSMAYHATLKAVPGQIGELYLTPGRLSGTTSQPFFHSVDAGKTWTRVNGVTGVAAYGFGKAFPGATHSAIYLAGYVNGVYGIYRSTDSSASWTLLGTYPTGRTSPIIDIDGDKDTAGRVYLAVSGSGWVYGALNATDTLSADLPGQEASGPETTSPEDPTTGTPTAETTDSPGPANQPTESPAPEDQVTGTPTPKNTESPAPGGEPTDSPSPGMPTSSPTPETPAPETPAPETPAPETPAPETPAPETPAPWTLKATVTAPAHVRTSRSFVVSVSAQSPLPMPLSYHWSMNGCRVSHPERATTRVTCVAPRGTVRHLKIRVWDGATQSVKVLRTVTVRATGSR